MRRPLIVFLILCLVTLACVISIKVSGSMEQQCGQSVVSIEIEGGAIWNTTCKNSVVTAATTAGELTIDVSGGSLKSVKSTDPDLNCHAVTPDGWECQKEGITIWVDIKPIPATGPSV